MMDMSRLKTTRRLNDNGIDLVDHCGPDSRMVSGQNHEGLRLWSAGGHPAGYSWGHCWRMDHAHPGLLRRRPDLVNRGGDAGGGAADLAFAQAEVSSLFFDHK